MNFIQLTQKKKGHVLLVNTEHVAHIAAIKEGSRIQMTGFGAQTHEVAESVAAIATKLGVQH